MSRIISDWRVAHLAATAIAIAVAVQALGASDPWGRGTAPVLAILEFVVPLLTGALLGVAIREGLGRPSRARAGVLFGVVAGLTVVIAHAGRVGLWDSVLMAGIAAWACADAARGAGNVLRHGAMLAAGTTIVLGVAEVGARLLLPDPGGVFRQVRGAIVLPRINLSAIAPCNQEQDILSNCAYLYPDQYAAVFSRQTTRAQPAQPVVLHLGDSMTFGVGVDQSQAFPALLEARDPGVSYVNAGAPRTSVDFHYLVLRRWADRLPVKLVVMTLFFNDLPELDEPFPCCTDGPLLTYGGDGGAPIDRCPQMAWPPGYNESWDWFVRYSPPPFPLRLATSVSYLMRHIEVAIARFQAPPSNVGTQVWAHFERVLTAIRDETARRHIRLLVVSLPLRAALEGRANPVPEFRDGIKTLGDKLGIDVVSAWEVFGQAVERNGSDRYFLPPADFHFSPEGHQLLADWLRPLIRARIDDGTD